MFSRKTNSSKIDPEQRELIEKAQNRARQKKRLYQHFILFLIGSAIFILLNVILDYGRDVQPFGIDWFVWAILIWGIIFLFHAFNVYVTNKFLGKDWENRQVEKLVAKQQERIAELEEKVAKDYPLPEKTTPLFPPQDSENPDSPINS